MTTLSRFANLGYAAVKSKVDSFDQWPAWQKVRRGFRAPLYRLSDTGLFGLTPLKTHILICGFPAAGTTLLQLMIENGLPQARRFGKEKGGWRAATYSSRNHAVLISKQPQDLLRLEPLTEFYSGRKAQLKTIVMLRDPRDLLTAKRPRGDQMQYALPAANWREYYNAFLKHNGREEVLVVRYEKLVENPPAEQRIIEEFVGHKMAVPFNKFESVERTDFDMSTLCGLRPVETSHVARWQAAEHRERIQQILTDLPELPSVLERLGYETGGTWADAYR